MAKSITDIAINELSLIFGQHKGEAWSPVNADAQVLTVKGDAQKSFVSRFFDSLKAKGYIMADNTPDDIDHDGDGAADYEAIITLVGTLYYDLQSAMCISDEQARTIGIKTAIDNFLAALDEMRGDKDGEKAKAGRRHSEADVKHLNGIKEATKAINDHLEALGTPADEEDDVDADGNDEDADKGAPVEIEGVLEDGLSPDEKAKDEKEPYGKDADYADPGFQEDGKKRYPLDTKEHVRAAASFFGRKKNRAKYTKEQRKHIDDAIAEAKKKFDIKASVTTAVEADTKAVEDLIAAKAAEIDAQVSEKLSAAQAAFDAATKAIKDEAQGLIDAAKAEAEAAKAAAAEAEAKVKAVVTEAMKPAAPGFVPTQRLDGATPDDPAAQSTKAELLATKPSSIAQAIKLQNLIHS